MVSENPLFILVPGIMHAPSHFQLLEEALKSNGYESISVSLPNIGESAATAAPGDDAKAVRTAVQQSVDSGRNVILMCHSFGGVPGFQAVYGLEKGADRKNRGVVRIIFLNAFIVKEGECSLDALIRTGQEPPPWIENDPSNEAVHIPNKLAPEYLFNDLDEPTAEKWAAALLPISTNHQTEKVENSCWTSKIPKTYIFSDNDKALWPKTQQGMLDQVKDSTWTTKEFSSGHSPFLSQPEALAELLSTEANSDLLNCQTDLSE